VVPVTNPDKNNVQTNIKISSSEKEKVDIEINKTNENQKNNYTCEDFLIWLFRNLKDNDFIEISNNCKFSDYAQNVKKVITIARNWNSRNVYFGVNPRFRIPNTKSKRASSEDILKCIAVFLDFDFKTEVQGVPREIQDEFNKKGYAYYKNILYTKDTKKNKIIQIAKIPYEEFLQLILDKFRQLGLNEDYLTIIDSGFGYHVYIRLKNPIKPDKWKELQQLLITFFNDESVKPDINIKNPDRLMRLPDTLNTRYEDVGVIRQCRVLKIAEKEISFNDLYKRLKAVVNDEKIHKISLNDKQIKDVTIEIDDDEISSKAEEIAQILERVYVTGYRNQIVTGLAGLLRKAKWSEDQAEKLVEKICKCLKDDEINNRINAVKSTFKKPPKDVSYKMLIESIINVLRDTYDNEAEEIAHDIFKKITEIVGYSLVYVKDLSKESKKVKRNQVVAIRTYYENGETVGIRKVDDNGNKVYISDYYVAEVVQYNVFDFTNNTSEPSETRYDVIFKNRFTNEEKKYLFYR